MSLSPDGQRTAGSTGDITSTYESDDDSDDSKYMYSTMSFQPLF